MARMRQTDLSAARLDELLSAGNPHYRRIDDGRVEHHCSTCGTWKPADTQHFYVVSRTHNKDHPPRYRSPCRACDGEACRRRQRMAAEAPARPRQAAPAAQRPHQPPALPTPVAPVRIRASALPEPLTGMRECRNCGVEQVLSADYFEPRGCGFSTVCNDCKSDVEHRAIARKAPLILPSAAGATRSAR